MLDPDDQPMWERAKTVAPTPNSTIVQPVVDNNFDINSTHLNMIQENNFDGYLQADPHDHIHEFLAICGMFKYGETLLQKCHGHGLTKGAIIQIFYHGLDESTHGILDITAGGIFLYKTPNQAFQFLEDKVLFKLDWSTKSQNNHHQESVAFANGSNSNDDNS
ncbi:hypothetical protein Tco_0127879 [Tanacetum coccineum]